MGRTVVAEESVKSTLTSSKESQRLPIGLLIGKVTEGKDLVCLAVHTPPLQDFNTGADKEDEGTDTFLDWWVVEHASQVYGLLPGGMNVIGVFLCCPSQQLPTLQARLSKLLTDIGSCQEFKGQQPHQHSVLLHYCVTKKKLKCQTIDLTDTQAGFKPAELKLKSHVSQWCQIEATVCLDAECYVTPSPLPVAREAKDTKESGISRELARAGVNSVLDAVQRGVVTLRGHLAKQDSVVLKQSSKKQQSNEVIQATLYLKKPVKELTPPTRLPSARKVTLNGQMSTIAYVPPKATFAEATSAVKQDVCRSLVSRVQAMVEGCSQSETECEQLPLRVGLSAPAWQFNFTEYSLPHEDLKECVNRASDLLGQSSEVISAQPMEQFKAKDERRNTEQDHTPSAYEGGGFKTYYGLISIFASVVAVLISISLWILLQ